MMFMQLLFLFIEVYKKLVNKHKKRYKKYSLYIYCYSNYIKFKQ